MLIILHNPTVYTYTIDCTHARAYLYCSIDEDIVVHFHPVHLAFMTS